MLDIEWLRLVVNIFSIYRFGKKIVEQWFIGIPKLLIDDDDWMKPIIMLMKDIVLFALLI